MDVNGAARMNSIHHLSCLLSIIIGEKDANCDYRRLGTTEGFQSWGDMKKTVFLKVNSGSRI